MWAAVVGPLLVTIAGGVVAVVLQRMKAKTENVERQVAPTPADDGDAPTMRDLTLKVEAELIAGFAGLHGRFDHLEHRVEKLEDLVPRVAIIERETKLLPELARRVEALEKRVGALELGPSPNAGG